MHPSNASMIVTAAKELFIYPTTTPLQPSTSFSTPQPSKPSLLSPPSITPKARPKAKPKAKPEAKLDKVGCSENVNVKGRIGGDEWWFVGCCDVVGLSTCKQGGTELEYIWSGRIRCGERVDFTFPLERGKVGVGGCGSGGRGRGVVVCSEIVRFSTLASGECHFACSQLGRCRFSTVVSGEIGRISNEWARCLLPLVRDKKVQVEGVCKSTPNGSTAENEEAISDNDLDNIVGIANGSELEEMESPSALLSTTLHPCWDAYNLADKRKFVVYVNAFSGEATVEFPSTLQMSRGILADAIGLGKTIMTISLLLAHTKRGGSLDRDASSQACSESNEMGNGSDQSSSSLKKVAKFSGFDKLKKQKQTLIGGGNLIICPMTLIGQWKVKSCIIGEAGPGIDVMRRLVVIRFRYHDEEEDEISPSIRYIASLNKAINTKEALRHSWRQMHRSSNAQLATNAPIAKAMNVTMTATLEVMLAAQPQEIP
ncbi:helicase [Tanacetum coccineum]|uniref:Helicase n=1 Tax=Tanacetum coccineum TaxID=301880 RepID=A0ABQ5HKD9_9ASTR